MYIYVCVYIYIYIYIYVCVCIYRDICEVATTKYKIRNNYSKMHTITYISQYEYNHFHNLAYILMQIITLHESIVNIYIYIIII